MPRPRFDKLAPERRLQILETAARAFADQGYAGASFNRILDDASVSKGAAYYYFDDKADLFAAVIEHYFEELFAGTDRVDPATLTAATYWPRLHALYRRQFDVFATRSWVFRVVKSAQSAAADPQVGARLAPRMADVGAWLMGLFARGRALELIRRDLPDPLLLALIGGLDGAADAWLFAHWDTLPPDERGGLVDKMFDAVRALVAPPRETTRGR